MRTGDSSSSVRARQALRLPTALVTTPESLKLMLSRAHWRERFAHLQAVVVDEWHELLSSKRGVQTELALARLRGLHAGLRTWGLSAKLANLDEALTCLVGTAPARTRIVRGLDTKTVEITSALPPAIVTDRRFNRASLNVEERISRVKRPFPGATGSSAREWWHFRAGADAKVGARGQARRGQARVGPRGTHQHAATVMATR